MWRAMQCIALVLLVAGSAAAVDVTLRDGTVISATSYRLTGSYIMLEMADGRHVAYDVADVDLDALRAAEAAAAPAPEPVEEAGGKLSSGRSLKDAATVGEVDGLRLLAPETVAAARSVQAEGPDKVILMPTRFGLGFSLPPMLDPGCPESAFGHPGAGGSLGSHPCPDALLGEGGARRYR